MADKPLPVTAGAIPWFHSKVFIGAATTVVTTLISLSPKAAAAIGLDTGNAGTVVEATFQVIAFLAGVYTAVKRQESPGQPLTLTQAAADIHPATVAVVQTQAAMAQAGIPTAVETQAKIVAASNQPSGDV